MIAKIFTARMHPAGEKAPPGFRLAYHDFLRNTHVYYPVGIHWIVSFGRYVWEWSHRWNPWLFSAVDQKMMAHYSQVWESCRKEFSERHEKELRMAREDGHLQGRIEAIREMIEIAKQGGTACSPTT